MTARTAAISKAQSTGHTNVILCAFIPPATMLFFQGLPSKADVRGLCFQTGRVNLVPLISYACT